MSTHQFLGRFLSPRVFSAYNTLFSKSHVDSYPYKCLSVPSAQKGMGWEKCKRARKIGIFRYKLNVYYSKMESIKYKAPFCPENMILPTMQRARECYFYSLEHFRCTQKKTFVAEKTLSILWTFFKCKMNENILEDKYFPIATLDLTNFPYLDAISITIIHPSRLDIFEFKFVTHTWYYVQPKSQFK